MPATTATLPSSTDAERTVHGTAVQPDVPDNLHARPSQRLDHAALAAIDRIVAAAPPLTSSRREKLATLLGGVTA
mgnify:CR=1 FL=1